VFNQQQWLRGKDLVAWLHSRELNIDGSGLAGNSESLTDLLAGLSSLVALHGLETTWSIAQNMALIITQ
jgi:hypothetical protein